MNKSKETTHLDQKQDKNVKKLGAKEETAEPVADLLQQESKIPLFLRGSSDGQKGNAQDEKDKVEE